MNERVDAQGIQLQEEFNAARSSRQLFPDTNVFISEEQEDESVQTLINYIQTKTNTELLYQVSDVLNDQRFQLLINSQNEERETVADFCMRSLSGSYGDTLLNLSYAVYEYIDSQDITSSSPQNLQ